jgi:Na+/melibiose symporter-like transporter
LIAGLPILALIFGFAIFTLYPLSGQRLADLRDKLQALHAQKGIV